MSVVSAIAKFFRRGGETIEPAEADVRRVRAGGGPVDVSSEPPERRQHRPDAPDGVHPSPHELNEEHRRQ